MYKKKLLGTHTVELNGMLSSNYNLHNLYKRGAHLLINFTQLLALVSDDNFLIGQTF